jgi:hypothetical protein
VAAHAEVALAFLHHAITAAFMWWR